jgi:hypothetical protein
MSHMCIVAVTTALDLSIDLTVKAVILLMWSGRQPTFTGVDKSADRDGWQRKFMTCRVSA